MKVLRELSLNPSKVFFVNFDKEIYAQISFPDYQSCKSFYLYETISSLAHLPGLCDDAEVSWHFTVYEIEFASDFD